MPLQRGNRELLEQMDGILELEKAYGAPFREDGQRLSALLSSLRSGDWDSCCAQLQTFSFGRLGALRGFEDDVLRSPMTPEEYMDAQEERLALYDALAQLPPVQARRVYRHYILGMSKAEIAAAEGADKGRVCHSINKGLQNLKKILENTI